MATTTEDKPSIRKRAEDMFFWWRVFLTVGGVLVIAWTQFLGPGVQKAARDWIGQTENAERLSYIEDNIAPPTVVDWETAIFYQVGDCTIENCDYALFVGRTEFGMKCGEPTSVNYWIRGRDIRSRRLAIHESFQPVELGRLPEMLTLPFVISKDIPDGEYFWRSEVEYPTCVGPREPITRYSPWFPITIGKQS